MYAYKITNLINGKAYIGITEGAVATRLIQHKSEARRLTHCSALHLAIHKYGETNFAVDQIAEAASWSELLVLERGLIAEHGTFRPNGYNLTIGGEGRRGAIQPPDAVRRTSEKNKGKRRPIAAIEAVALWHRGKKRSPETCAKIAAKALGRKCSAETCAQMSASRRGRKRTAATQEKMRLALMGHPVSQETRNKIGAANRGKKRSLAWRQNMAAAMRRKWVLRKAIVRLACL